MYAKVETYFGSAPEGWDSTVAQFGGPVFHSTVWARYQKETRKVQPLFLLLRDQDGEVCAGTAAFFRQSQRPIASLIFRDLVLPSHPFVRDKNGTVAAYFMDKCEEVGQELGCARLRLESFMGGSSPFVPASHGYTETCRMEFSLDLSRNIDSLWQGMRKDQREKIKRLKREGIIVEVGGERADIVGLRSVREATQEKRTQRGQGYELSADDEFYDGLYEHLVQRGAARLFVAKYDNQVIAALFFAAFGGQAYSIFSGSSDFGYKLGAQSGLFWTAVETFKSEGFQVLNRGGVPASAAEETDPLHGIYLFKLRLGTTPVVCRSGEKVLSLVRNSLVKLRDRWRELKESH